MNARLLVLLVAAGAAPVAAPALAAPPPEPAPAAQAGLPGVDLAGLSPDQQKLLLDYAREAFCHCGCPHTLAQCLAEHRTCKHAPRMARLAARLVRSGAKKPDLVRQIAGYYASFERRAKLDVARFGPPLGSPDAKVSMVEVSDFTCPYCRLVRPTLEEFVGAHRDRVRLFYKPFPIESHPGALECAQAGEWAREKGLFWAMHDAMFDSPGARSAEALSDLARGLGGDPGDLRAALAEQRFLPKVRESQAEARAAGIRGTPTLFLNGRMLVLSDFSDEGLLFTLEDEEEWQQHGGWSRD